MTEIGKISTSRRLMLTSKWVASSAAVLKSRGESCLITQPNTSPHWKRSLGPLHVPLLESWRSRPNWLRPESFQPMLGNASLMLWYDPWTATLRALLSKKLPPQSRPDSRPWLWLPSNGARSHSIADRALPSEGSSLLVERRRRTIPDRFSDCGARQLIRTGDRCLDEDQTAVCGVPALPPRRTEPVALHVSVRAARCSVLYNHRSQLGVLGCQRQR